MEFKEIRIKQRNELIQATGKLDYYQLKLFFYVLYKRKKNQTQIKVPMKEVLDTLGIIKGGKTYKEMISSLEDFNIRMLTTLTVWSDEKKQKIIDERRKLEDRKIKLLLEDEDANKNQVMIIDEELQNLSLIPPYTVDELSEMSSNERRELDVYVFPKIQFISGIVKETRKNNIIEFNIHKDLVPYIDELQKRWTWIEFNEIIKLKNKYAIRIYEFCREKLGDNLNVLSYDWYLKDLRIYLGIEDKYKSWRDLNSKIINKAMKEINEKCSDVSFEYEPLKNRAVYGIRMKIYKSSFLPNFNKNKDSDKPKEEQIEETKKASENDEVKAENNTDKITTETNNVTNSTKVEYTDEVKNFKWWED